VLGGCGRFPGGGSLGLERSVFMISIAMGGYTVVTTGGCFVYVTVIGFMSGWLGVLGGSPMWSPIWFSWV
jgi:hypothetical protein